MKPRRTPNGKTCFDIRKQYQRVSYDLLIRYCKILRKMVDDGIVTTNEQYRNVRRKHDEQLMRFHDYAYKYANSVSCGSFSLWRE